MILLMEAEPGAELIRERQLLAGQLLIPSEDNAHGRKRHA